MNIILPKEGQLIKIGTNLLVTWQSNHSGEFDIDLLENGVHKTTIAEQVTGISHQWFVENVPFGDEYSVVIRITNQPGVADTSAVFEILPEIPQTNIEFVAEDLVIDDKTIRLYIAGQGETTILFENGMGNTAQEAWHQTGIPQALANQYKVITYNRSGYPPSTHNGEARGMENITYDLSKIIEQKSGDNKLILVGHSWGGPIIRYYSVMYPDKVDALLFVDPTHESAEPDITQQQEDAEVANWASAGNTGAEVEAMQIIETFNALNLLSDIPDIPVVVLTNLEFSQIWFDAHHELGDGITDFTHEGVDSGHFIQLEEPEVVYKYILELLEKI